MPKTFVMLRIVPCKLHHIYAYTSWFKVQLHIAAKAVDMKKAQKVASKKPAKADHVTRERADEKLCRLNIAKARLRIYTEKLPTRARLEEAYSAATSKSLTDDEKEKLANSFMEIYAEINNVHPKPIKMTKAQELFYKKTGHVMHPSVLSKDGFLKGSSPIQIQLQD